MIPLFLLLFTRPGKANGMSYVGLQNDDGLSDALNPTLDLGNRLALLC